MELIPIIEASLSIFTVFTAFFVILSYLLYKLRGKSPEKPLYLKEIASDNLLTIMIEQSRIVENDRDKIKRHERFKVVNPIQPPDISEAQTNEKISVLNTMVETYKASNVIIRHKEVQNKWNIYNLYSNSNLRPMHKLQTQKLKVVENA